MLLVLLNCEQWRDSCVSWTVLQALSSMPREADRVEVRQLLMLVEFFRVYGALCIRW